MRIKCLKMFVGVEWVGVRGDGKGGRRENGGKSAMVVGGIDAPELQTAKHPPLSPHYRVIKVLISQCNVQTLMFLTHRPK